MHVERVLTGYVYQLTDAGFWAGEHSPFSLRVLPGCSILEPGDPEMEQPKPRVLGTPIIPRALYRHADGGYYVCWSQCKGKHPDTGAWLRGVTYMSLHGSYAPCWTTVVRWNERFTLVLDENDRLIKGDHKCQQYVKTVSALSPGPATSSTPQPACEQAG